MIAEQVKIPSSVSAENLNFVTHTAQKESTPGNTEKEEISDNYQRAIFTKRHIFTLAMTFLLLTGGAISVYLLQAQFEEMNMSRMDTLAGMILLIVGIFLLVFRLGFLAYIARLFFLYKPVTSVTEEV